MKKYLLLFLCAILSLAGCDIHEYPEGEHDVDLALSLVFDYDLPQYKIIDYRTRSGEDGADAATDAPATVRYTVDFYRDDNDSAKPDYRFTFTGTDVENLARTEHVLVAPARYKILAWTDFVDKEGGAPDYDIVDMKNIAFHGDDPESTIYTGSSYIGNDDFRDAFRGEAPLDLSSFNRNGSHAEVTVSMERPMAKFNIIATDREDLLDFWHRQQAARGIETKSDSEELALFHVRIAYNGYLPSLFNNFKNRPVSSDTGILFEGSIQELESGDAQLAFDYVMVNGQESSVNISIGIYDNNWEEISVIPGIDVPLLRSHLTTLRGKFLTAGSQSGISINPAYDGEFNVYINM